MIIETDSGELLPLPHPFRRHEDADCFAEHPAVLGTEPFAAAATKVEQFAARLKKSRLVLPVQAVAGDIFVWTVRPRRIVNSINCAV